MIYIIIILSIALYVILPQPVLDACGVSNGHLYYAFCYMYAHASWTHLLINVVSMLIIWRPIRNLYMARYNVSSHQLHLTAYAAAVLAGVACASSTPTVGMSGCVFFLLGVLLMLNPTKRQLLNYIWIVAAIIVQWCFGKSNVPLHLFAFVEGIIFVCIREFMFQYKNHTGLFSIDKE